MLREVVALMLMIVLFPVALWSQELEGQPMFDGTTVDNEVEAEAAEYRALLAQPPEKLADLCRQRGARLLADLRFGRAIAKGEVREKNLEGSRVELLAQAAEKQKQYEDLRDRVRAELEQVRQQFADDSTECDRRLFALVNMHRPTAVALRDEAKRLEVQAAEKDSRLSQVRSELASLGQDRDLLAQGHQFRRSEAPLDLVAGMKNDDGGIEAETLKQLGLDAEALGLIGLGSDHVKRTTVAKPVTTEQVRQVVDEFDSLFC
jgi:hypothetical protein